MDVVYSHTGGGETLVLLHGFLEERSMWDVFTLELSKEFEVIAVDLLGQGESGNTGYIHTMEEQAAAVAAVLEQEKVVSCTVIGHSMGGYVGLAMAENQRHQLRGLVLFHSTVYADSESKKKDRQRVIKLIQRNKRVYIKAAIPWLFATHLRQQLAPQIEQLMERASCFSEQGIIANLRGITERKSRAAVWRDGAFKKLIIHGEMDGVITHKEVQKAIALCPNAQLKVLHKVGHVGHLEAPKECLGLLMQFCKN